MHSMGAIDPSSASTTSAMLISRAGARACSRRASLDASHQPGLAQAGDEVLEVCERQPVMGGDLRERDRVVAGAPSKLDHHAHAVLGLC